MKFSFILFAIIWVTNLSFAQNVGVGIKTPTRARFEVHGKVGNTTAIFGGDTTGISLQSNFPTIGFNEYYNNGQRYIAKGFAAQQFFDPNLGYFAIDIFGKGDANALGINPHRILALTYSTEMIFGDGTGRIGINKTPDNSNSANAVLQIRQVGAGANYGIALLSQLEDHRWRLTSSAGDPDGFFSLDYNGWGVGFFSGTDGRYFNYSDRQLKNDIRSLSPVLSKVMQLKPVQYKMKKNNKGETISTGFIAQDVKEIFPELVTVAPNPGNEKSLENLHAISYSDFGIIAIKAIQEQQAMIDALKKELETLKRAIKANGK